MDGTLSKREYVDVISVISMIAVVFLHANGCFWTYSTEGYWKSANLIDALFYFAVPCFFMISGICLLDYRDRYNTKAYFIKRLKKTVIPFVAWSCIGAIYAVLAGKETINIDFFKFFIKNIVSYKYVEVYWFFIPLFVVYLSIPIFSAIPKPDRIKIYYYSVIIGFVINALIPFLCIFNALDFLPNNLVFPVSQGYILFALIGYLICDIQIDRRYRMIIYIVSILAFLLHLFGTYYLSVRDGSVSRVFKGYTALPSVLYSIGVFILLKELSPIIMKNAIVKKIILFLRKYTFAIYLMHWFLIDAAARLTRTDTSSIVFRFVFPFVVVVACCFLTCIMRKIKYIRAIVP